jgi:hypothetical protein
LLGIFCYFFVYICQTNLMSNKNYVYRYITNISEIFGKNISGVLESSKTSINFRNFSHLVEYQPLELGLII